MPTTIVYFAVFYIAFQHLIAPLIVWATNRSPCRYTFPPISWDAPLAESDINVREAHRELETISFRPVAASGFGASHASMFFVVYRHPSDLAFATLMRGRNWLGTQAIVVFTQIYSDGRQLALSNAFLPGVYPSWRRMTGVRFPGLTNVSELFSRFAVLRDRFDGMERVELPRDQELAALEKFNNEQVQYLCEIGYMSRDCDERGRRLSIIGAYRSSWKLLQPWKFLKNRRDRAEAMRRTAI